MSEYLSSNKLIQCAVLLAVIGMSGCSSVGYLWHTSTGHLGVVSKKQSITSILENEQYDEKQRDQLANVLRIRAYATNKLHLPDNASYTEYVKLDRDYVTWSVFAAPELSLDPTRWCFWIVGCVPYRGYFEQARAQQFAEQLKQQGLDVYVAPIPAYSTLGWFNDPVLSTMLRNGEIVTAEYIFHELAHQQLYIKNDTSFNEAFASAVGRLGVRDWLRDTNKLDGLTRYEKSIEKRNALFGLTQTLRAKLQAIYTADTSEELKRASKLQAYREYENKVNELTQAWVNGEWYRKSSLANLNNAKLNARSTYNNLIPDFIALHQACNNSYEMFYTIVNSMQQLTKQQRLEYLRKADCKPVSADS